jgi:hypothetical protein
MANDNMTLEEMETFIHRRFQIYNGLWQVEIWELD